MKPPAVSLMKVFLVACLCIRQIRCDGFVEEVACGSGRMIIALNKTDPDVRFWLNNPASEPIVYVYGYKERAPCGAKLRDDNGVPQFNFSIPYGASCNMYLSKLEPHFLAAETTIAIEDINDDTPSKTMRINHVYCLYTSQVQALQTNDISTGHRIVASVGGKPKPVVQLVIRDTHGQDIEAAKFGDNLEFVLQLKADQAYKAISPKECQFSDKQSMEQSGARTLTFVQSGCPVSGLDEVIQPIQGVRDDIFYTQFQAFRFGNQTTVYAHCKVQVCLDIAACPQNCFHSLLPAGAGGGSVASSGGSFALEPLNSLILGNGTADVDAEDLIRSARRQFRRRTKRMINDAGFASEIRVRRDDGDARELTEVAISSAFAVLDDPRPPKKPTSHVSHDDHNRQVHPHPPVHTKGDSSDATECRSKGTNFFLVLSLAVLGALFLVSCILLACLLVRVRAKSKDCELHTLAGCNNSTRFHSGGPSSTIRSNSTWSVTTPWNTLGSRELMVPSPKSFQVSRELYE